MEAAAVRLYFLLEHNYSLDTMSCILLGYDVNSCTRNKFQQRQYCARVMHFSAFHSVCRRRRKLSSHVRGERGRSSFSMVDSEDSSD